MSIPPHLAAATVHSHLRTVTLVSGRPMEVQGDDERDWFNATRDNYTKQTAFSLQTDLLDLDRLLIHELMIYRWTCQLAAGKDYDGEFIDDPDGLRKNIQSYSAEVTRIKEAMGLSKSARDRAGTESVSDYINELKRRAKEFGVHRETQLTRALVLTKELFSLVGTYQRADEEERRKLDLSPESILTWISDVMKPEFDSVDAHFRANQQRFWVRQL